jgi:PAS domain S-box-containing protein
MEKSERSERISWRDSLSTRFSLTALILVVIAILIAGTFLVWIAYQTEQQTVLVLQKKNADTISILISKYIGSAQEKIQVFEESSFLDSLPPEDQKSALYNFLIHQKSMFSQFTVLDLNGSEISRISRFHTYSSDELANRGNDPVFTRVMEGQVSVSPIYISHESGLLSMELGVPIKNSENATIGALIAEVNCVRLWQEVSEQEVGTIGYAYIADKSGRFIAYQDVSEILNRYNEDLTTIPPVADFISQNPDRNHVYQYTGLSGEKVVGTYSPINGTEWAVIAELPENEAFAGIREMQWYLFAILISAMILAGAVGYLISVRFTNPIEDLTRTALKLKSGEWETEIHHTHRPDEVGVLSRAFVQMRDELKKLYSDMEEQLEELTLMQGELRQSEEQYRTIFENNGNALLLIEEDMTISLINHELEELWGYTKSEVEGKKKWTEFVVTDEDLKRMVLYHHERRQPDSSSPTSYEFSFKTKDGYVKDVIATVTMIPGTTRSLAAIIDITEKKEVESALIQARKKLSILNTITFNDIRSNIYVLAGYIDLKGESTQDPDMLNWIDRERKSIRNINNALVFAKDYQDMGLKPAGWQNVEQVFLYAVSHLDLSHISRNLNLKGLQVYADPLLEKVFFTLASNVLNHGGDVTVLSVFSVRSDNELIIVFEDNGRGVPESEKEEIFDEYSREKKGISLYFAREILGITSIGIREAGTEGKGARFEIIVPRGKYKVLDLSDPES